MTPAYVVSPLAPSHELGAFDCGVPELDSWLRGAAARGQAAGTCQVHVLTEGAPESVLGYFAITPTQVASDDLPSRLRGAGRIQGGYLLARLALHRDLRGGDLGPLLLREALETIVAAADRVGGRVIVVDAMNPGLVPYHERYGFRRAREGGLRLVMKMSTARKHLATGRPST